VSPTETINKDGVNNKDGVKREISVEVPAEEVTRDTEALVLN
jgi:hypothetical protein